MLSKISSMLDAVADSLEAKGLIKEAFEIDKVADMLDETEMTDEQAERHEEMSKGTYKKVKNEMLLKMAWRFMRELEDPNPVIIPHTYSFQEEVEKVYGGIFNFHREFPNLSKKTQEIGHKIVNKVEAKIAQELLKIALEKDIKLLDPGAHVRTPAEQNRVRVELEKELSEYMKSFRVPSYPKLKENDKGEIEF